MEVGRTYKNVLSNSSTLFYPFHLMVFLFIFIFFGLNSISLSFSFSSFSVPHLSLFPSLISKMMSEKRWIMKLKGKKRW